MQNRPIVPDSHIHIFLTLLISGMFALAIATIPLRVMASDGPKIFGVTDGSVYQEYVQPRWYDESATATLSVNGGTPESFASGQKISANGLYELRVLDSVLERVVRFEISSTDPWARINTNQDKDGTILEIDFKSGVYRATPVIAIWTEDVNGNFLQNLYVSSLAATNMMRFTNSRVNRPQAVPFWAHKACDPEEYGSDMLYLAQPQIPVPEDLDGVSGATQKAAFLLNTRAVANAVNDSRIKVFFEINQSFDSGWYFKGSNQTQEEDGTGTFSSDKYFGGSEEPAIVYSVEVDLDQDRTVILGGSDGGTQVMPVGYSHYGGRTGRLYTDFYADDNGTQRYKFDHAHRMVGLLTVRAFPGARIHYTGDFNRDNDVDGSDLSRLAASQDLLGPYLARVAANFGRAGH